MFETQYMWIAGLGFWLGFGLIQAIAVSFAVFYFIGKIVNFAFGLFSGVSVSEYTFTVLPEHYKSMKLDYDSKTSLINATATFTHKGTTHTRSYAKSTKPDQLEDYANSVQFALMTIIQKEIEEWNKHQS